MPSGNVQRVTGSKHIFTGISQVTQCEWHASDGTSAFFGRHEPSLLSVKLRDYDVMPIGMETRTLGVTWSQIGVGSHSLVQVGLKPTTKGGNSRRSQFEGI
jgi:hypothetical protein